MEQLFAMAIILLFTVAGALALTLLLQSIRRSVDQTEVILRQRDTHSNVALKEDLAAVVMRLEIEEDQSADVRQAWIRQLELDGHPLSGELEREMRVRRAYLSSARRILDAGRAGPNSFDPDFPSGVILELD